MAVIVRWNFFTAPRVGLQCVIVVFPDHTHLLFWTCPLQMTRFHWQITIHEMVLILKKLISYFLMEVFLAFLPMAYIYFTTYSFLREYVLMLVTSTTEFNW